jgi:hypothetical protein
MKGLTLKPDTSPGILMEASWDQNGDIDRASFLAEIVDGKQKIVQILQAGKIRSSQVFESRISGDGGALPLRQRSASTFEATAEPRRAGRGEVLTNTASRRR